jgi:colanic acid biosynthesis glycosyl transferase WcaI
MRILVLSIYYPPEPGANARIVSELAREWSRLGHEVTVLTDIPHYPDDKVPPEYQDGQRREETIDGVRVIRCPLVIRDRASTMGRLLNNISFAFSAFLRSRRAGKADVIYVYSPPIFLILGAWLMRVFKRAPVVFNVQDIYPDVAIAHGFLTNPLLVRGFKWFERWTYKRATRVTVISEGFRRNLLAKGVPDRKIDIIPNCVDADQFTPGPRDNDFRRTHAPNGEFMVLYGGNLGHAQGLETVIEAARLLEGKRDDIKFVVVGDGVEGEKLRALHKKYGLKNLHFVGPVPRETMPSIVDAADACLVILRAQKSRIWIQSKTYEIMAAGKPIIASIDSDGDNWRLVAESEGGLHATPGDPAALARAAEQLADDRELCKELGVRGRKHIEEWYRLERIARLYIEAMERATGAREVILDERTRPLRIAMINQFYPPDLSPTAHLAASLAAHRAAEGDVVTIVASSGGYVPAKGIQLRADSDNPRVHRVWTPGLGRANFARRFFDYAAFYILASWRLAVMPEQDVLISMTTPPCIGWTAALHKALHPRAKLILWNMDCYPDVAERSRAIKPGGLLARVMRSRNRAIFRRLDHLVCLDDAMAKLVCGEYAKENPVLPVTVIPNWESGSFFESPAQNEPWRPNGPISLGSDFIVLYLGNAGYGHEFDTVLNAAEQLRDDGIVFLFVGGGSKWESIAAAKQKRGLTNVLMHGYVPKEMTPSVMDAAHCALTTLHDSMLGTMSPSKLHSNLAMGLPIVYVGPAGSNVDHAIARFDCGASFRHGDAAGIVAFLRSLKRSEEQRRELSRRARAAFDHAYSSEVCLPAFDRVILNVAGRGADEASTAPAGVDVASAVA